MCISLLREVNSKIINDLAELHETFDNYSQDTRDDGGEVVHLEMDAYEDKGAKSPRQNATIGAAAASTTICLGDNGEVEKEEGGEEEDGMGEGREEERNYEEYEEDTDYESVYHIDEDSGGNETERREVVPIKKRKVRVPKGPMADHFSATREKKLAMKRAIEEYNSTAFPSSSKPKVEDSVVVPVKGKGKGLVKMGGHDYSKKK